ncbi:hypothetical protein ABK040_013062 [Willaertia magna]
MLDNCVVDSFIKIINNNNHYFSNKLMNSITVMTTTTTTTTLSSSSSSFDNFVNHNEKQKQQLNEIYRDQHVIVREIINDNKKNNINNIVVRIKI